MKTKDYSMREMVIDQCLGTGREFTREALQTAVNKALEQRGMLPVTAKVTILKDLDEMNEKFYRIYGTYGIISEKRGRFHYYRYKDGIESIYNRELTADEIEKLHEVRNLMQGLRGMPRLEWLDQMSARFDQQLIGSGRIIASFEEGTAGDDQFFQQLFNAIDQRQVVTIEYRRFGLESKQRIIYPYHMKQYLRRWYLFATIKDHDFVTCFSLDRILSVRENKEEEFRESAIDFNHYFDDIVGVTHPDNGVVEHIVIEGDSWAEYYLRTLPIHPLQQLESLGEKGCRVTMELMVNPELEREILSYGEHLKVKAPKALRQRLSKLSAILQEEYLENDD
jgi:predicted DNA-binding transcriptional regulator YafY